MVDSNENTTMSDMFALLLRKTTTLARVTHFAEQPTTSPPPSTTTTTTLHGWIYLHATDYVPTHAT